MGRDPVTWFDYLPTITAVDLLDAGACISGVSEAIERHKTLSMESEKAIRFSDWAAKAAHSDGDGDGDGYGDG